MSRIILPLLVLTFSWVSACGGDDGLPQEAAVVINGRALDSNDLDDFERRYGARPTGGPWWYDAASGLYGPSGGPAAGFLMPGHDFGPLGADASGGGTGVFVNGRELPPDEYRSWSLLFGELIWPGRYWLDGAANFGSEGYPAAGNLLFVLGARLRGGAGGGGDNFWSTRFSAGNSNADNSAGYVSVPGVGPVGYGM